MTDSQSDIAQQSRHQQTRRESSVFHLKEELSYRDCIEKDDQPQTLVESEEQNSRLEKMSAPQLQSFFPASKAFRRRF
jgi:hypothetical protein